VVQLKTNKNLLSSVVGDVVRSSHDVDTEVSQGIIDVGSRTFVLDSKTSVINSTGICTLARKMTSNKKTLL